MRAVFIEESNARIYDSNDLVWTDGEVRIWRRPTRGRDCRPLRRYASTSVILRLPDGKAVGLAVLRADIDRVAWPSLKQDIAVVDLVGERCCVDTLGIED